MPNFGGCAPGLSVVPKKNSVTDTSGNRKNSKLCTPRTRMMPAVVMIVIAAQKTRPDVTTLSQNASAREWPGQRSAALRCGRSFAAALRRRGQDRIPYFVAGALASAALCPAGSSLASVA